MSGAEATGPPTRSPMTLIAADLWPSQQSAQPVMHQATHVLTNTGCGLLKMSLVRFWQVCIKF